MNTIQHDAVQERITAIMHSRAPLDVILHQLEDLEPMIIDHYSRGLTEVKPVSMMTADDLCGA
jgi:hypothetical protein